MTVGTQLVQHVVHKFIRQSVDLLTACKVDEGLVPHTILTRVHEYHDHFYKAGEHKEDRTACFSSYIISLSSFDINTGPGIGQL